MLKIFDEYKGLRKELYILCIGRLVTNLGSMIWPMLTLILNKKLSMNASTIATYMLVINLISLPVTIYGGKLADSIDKKKIIIFCDLISVFCYFVAGIVPMGNMTIMMLVIASIMQSAEQPSYEAFISDLTNSEERERAFSLSYLTANLGLILAPTLGGLLFKDFLWLAFIINAVAILISTILIFFFIKNVEKVTEKTTVYEKEVNDISSLKYILNNRVIILIVLVNLLSGLVYNQYGYLMPLELGRVHGETGSLIYGTFSSINCIVVVIFTPIITRIFRKLRDVDKMIAGELFIVAGFLIFIATLNIFYVGYFAMFVFTVGEVFNTLGYSPFVSRRIPSNHRGRITSILNVAVAMFTAVVQKFISMIWDNNSYTAWVIILIIGLIDITIILIMKSLDKKDYADLYDKEVSL